MPEDGGWNDLAMLMTHAFTPSPEEAEREAREASWRDRRGELDRCWTDARTLLLIRFPFFGRLALHLKVHFTERVARMGLRADGNLYLNPHDFPSLPSGQQAYLLAHAVLHLAHGHFARIGHRDPVLWNQATDVVIDEALDQSGLPAPAGFGTPNRNRARWQGLDAEEVYDALVAEAWAGRDGGTRGKPTDVGEAPDPGDCDHGATEVLVRGGLNLSKLMTMWGQWARSAAAHARRAGQIGLGEERFIRPDGPSQLPWDALLHRWIHAQSEPRMNSKRPSRRGVAVARAVEMQTGVRTFLPGQRWDMAPVTVALDLSGSISAREAGAMLAETRGILARYRCSVRVLTFDVEVHEDREISDVRALRPRGGGGTSLVPLTDRLEFDIRRGRPVSGLIVFTDLEAEFPERPPSFAVLFVDVSGGSKVPPFGDVIRCPRPRVGQ